MFKCAGTFQFSFTVVNAFFYQRLTSEFLVWKLLTPVNPSLRRDNVYQRLQLKVSAVCVLSYTSAYCYHWHCFNLHVIQAIQIDFFFTNILSRCCFTFWQSFTYLCTHPKFVNESANSSTRPDITNCWILSFVFAVVIKHAVYFLTLYINLYCTFQKQCILLWMFWLCISKLNSASSSV
jgi:hypothetical protein